MAYYKKKTIHLYSVERELWQRLYIASLKQEVTCVHCHSPLKMEITIQSPPMFIHANVQEECLKVAEAIEKKRLNEKNNDETSQSRQAIRLPQRREINEARQDLEAIWKAPEKITAIRPFIATESAISSSVDGYRKTLQEHGIEIDHHQWSAITTTEGPLLIIAGAGSGKTRVLTTRAAYMLQHHSPKEMILVTFTAKAAKEMKERMRTYPGIDQAVLHQLVIGTFHSIFYKMLLHHDFTRWNSANLLKQDWQRLAMIKEAGREIDLEEKEFAFDQALTQISWWKNHLLSPNQVKATNQFEERSAYLYTRYEQMRETKQQFDFDDMLLGTYELLSEHPSLLRKYQQRFSYLSIDEFQDINKVQVEIISMLAEGTKNICVVGDDDQSIYAFRGSDPNYILTFKEHYPDTKVVVLEDNYRSNHEIISAANNIITMNRTRFPKTIRAQTSNNEAPLLFFPYDEEEEATMIVTHIKKQIENGARPEDFAVLFRTNSSARALFERFISSSLPFQIDADGDSFYRRNMVRKILAFLRLALDPNDAGTLPDMAGALFLKQHVVQEIKALSITKDCTFVEAFSQLEGLHAFQLKKLRDLPNQFKKLKKMTPLDAISYIESSMGLHDYIKKQGNEGNKIERGSDDVRDLKVVARLHSSIETFLEHTEHMTAKFDEIRKKRGQQDAVQLMTIHRAKGLEYKTVYLIGVVEGGLPHDYALDAWREGDDKPLEEERRLMYVAMTRAKLQLYVSIPMMRRGTKAFRSRFTREINRLSSPKLKSLQ